MSTTIAKLPKLGGQRNRKWKYDFREMQNSVLVSISSGLERLRAQLFTVFHKTLYTARKCGRLETCCFLDKPEVDYRF